MAGWDVFISNHRKALCDLPEQHNTKRRQNPLTRSWFEPCSPDSFISLSHAMGPEGPAGQWMC